MLDIKKTQIQISAFKRHFDTYYVYRENINSVSCKPIILPKYFPPNFENYGSGKKVLETTAFQIDATSNFIK